MTVETIIACNLITWCGLLLLVAVLRSFFGPSRSRIYRQDLSNMYVAGKIKQIASNEGIDLNAEFSAFAKITKNKKIDYQELDLTVERELQEKIADSKIKAIKEDKA